MGFSLGWDDLLSIPTAGGYTGLKAATGGATDVSDIGTGAKDLSRVGQNGYSATPWGITPQVDANGNVTGYQGMQGTENSVTPGQAFGQEGLNRQDINNSRNGQGYAMGQMQDDRGAQAGEDLYLSNQEDTARNGDEMGAMQLMRERAMGQAPSEAAYMMQSGLNQGLANQQALAGSARGSAALSQAQANMQGNAANMEQNAYTAAGQLRAREMADATGQYGQMAQGVRGQDQNRLAQSNQMQQFNVNANDQYKLGMGGLGVAYGNLTNANQNTNQGYFNTGAGIGNQNADRGMQAQQLNSQNWNETQGLNAGVAQANSDKASQNRDMWLGFGGKALGMAGSAAGAHS